MKKTAFALLIILASLGSDMLAQTSASKYSTQPYPKAWFQMGYGISMNNRNWGGIKEKETITNYDLKMGVNLSRNWGVWASVANINYPLTNNHELVYEGIDMSNYFIVSEQYIGTRKEEGFLISAGLNYTFRCSELFEIIPQVGITRNFAEGITRYSVLKENGTNNEHRLVYKHDQRAYYLNSAIDLKYRVNTYFYLALTLRYLQGLEPHLVTRTEENIYDNNPVKTTEYESKKPTNLGAIVALGFEF